MPLQCAGGGHATGADCAKYRGADQYTVRPGTAIGDKTVKAGIGPVRFSLRLGQSPHRPCGGLVAVPVGLRANGTGPDGTVLTATKYSVNLADHAANRLPVLLAPKFPDAPIGGCTAPLWCCAMPCRRTVDQGRLFFPICHSRPTGLQAAVVVVRHGSTTVGYFRIGARSHACSSA